MSDTLASAFSQANKPSVQIQSPFEVMKEAGVNARLMNDNRLFQAQQLRGSLIRQATGADGNVDMSTYNRLASQAGPGIDPAMSQGLDQSTKIAGEQQTQNLARNAYLGGQLGALLDLPDDQLNRGLAAAAGRIRDSRMLPPGEIDTVLSHLPSDPKALRQQLRQAQLALQGPGAQETQIYGTRPEVNTGPTVEFPVVPSAAKGGPGPTVTMGTTPGQKMAPVVGPATATGAPTTQSASEYARSRGLDPNTGNPLPNPAFKDVPGSLRGPNQAPPAAIPPTATGVGPAAQTAMADTGGSSSKAYQATSDAGVKAVSQRALLQNMLGDATQFTTGPLAEKWKNTKAIVQQVAGVFGLSPVDAQKLAANEDLDKVAAQLADAQGAGSDARLAVNQGANPSSHNTPEGLRLILGKLTGNADYLAARAQLASQYQRTQDPTSAGAREFEAKIGAKLDPRAFQYNRLNPEQKRHYLSEMTDQKSRDAFKRTYLDVQQMGVLPGG